GVRKHVEDIRLLGARPAPSGKALVFFPVLLPALLDGAVIVGHDARSSTRAAACARAARAAGRLLPRTRSYPGRATPARAPDAADGAHRAWPAPTDPRGHRPERTAAPGRESQPARRRAPWRARHGCAARRCRHPARTPLAPPARLRASPLHAAR